ncbi:DMT family transporter [Ligilactobacillus hayakitensis]|uniref:DMT family transporter n=1 Tax=Ligilactobacillus hayakitensis TaxID=396716 RepID=UPI000688F935|nr:DMT family transporter [Ligilactobacillus hayakitensis]
MALCAWFIGRNRNPIIFLAVLFGLAGMYFLCITNSLNNIYFGDILNFLSAFAFAGHILVIDYYRNHDSLIISWLQFIFAGGFALILALFIEHPALTDILQAALPIAYAGIISSGVGYTLQIIGQKYADPTASSIILSTEAVFSAIAGWLILNQVMSPREIFGATLVFAAVIIAQIPDIIKFSKKSL